MNTNNKLLTEDINEESYNKYMKIWKEQSKHRELYTKFFKELGNKEGYTASEDGSRLFVHVAKEVIEGGEDDKVDWNSIARNNFSTGGRFTLSDSEELSDIFSQGMVYKSTLLNGGYRGDQIQRAELAKVFIAVREFMETEYFNYESPNGRNTVDKTFKIDDYIKGTLVGGGRIGKAMNKKIAMLQKYHEKVVAPSFMEYTTKAQELSNAHQQAKEAGDTELANKLGTELDNHMSVSNETTYRPFYNKLLKLFMNFQTQFTGNAENFVKHQLPALKELVTVFGSDPNRIGLNNEAYYMMYSHRGDDVAGMSGDKNWRSCMRLPSPNEDMSDSDNWGVYADSESPHQGRGYLVADVIEGTISGYLMSKESGDNIMQDQTKQLSKKHAMGRVNVKPWVTTVADTSVNDFLIYPEIKYKGTSGKKVYAVYGQQITTKMEARIGEFATLLGKEFAEFNSDNVTKVDAMDLDSVKFVKVFLDSDGQKGKQSTPDSPLTRELYNDIGTGGYVAYLSADNILKYQNFENIVQDLVGENFATDLKQKSNTEIIKSFKDGALNKLLTSGKAIADATKHQIATYMKVENTGTGGVNIVSDFTTVNERRNKRNVEDELQKMLKKGATFKNVVDMFIAVVEYMNNDTEYDEIEPKFGATDLAHKVRHNESNTPFNATSFFLHYVNAVTMLMTVDDQIKLLDLIYSTMDANRFKNTQHSEFNYTQGYDSFTSAVGRYTYLFRTVDNPSDEEDGIYAMVDDSRKDLDKFMQLTVVRLFQPFLGHLGFYIKDGDKKPISDDNNMAVLLEYQDIGHWKQLQDKLIASDKEYAMLPIVDDIVVQLTKRTSLDIKEVTTYSKLQEQLTQQVELNGFSIDQFTQTGLVLDDSELTNMLTKNMIKSALNSRASQEFNFGNDGTHMMTIINIYTMYTDAELKEFYSDKSSTFVNMANEIYLRNPDGDMKSVTIDGVSRLRLSQLIYINKCIDYCANNSREQFQKLLQNQLTHYYNNLLSTDVNSFLNHVPEHIDNFAQIVGNIIPSIDNSNVLTGEVRLDNVNEINFKCIVSDVLPFNVEDKYVTMGIQLLTKLAKESGKNEHYIDAIVNHAAVFTYAKTLGGEINKRIKEAYDKFNEEYEKDGKIPNLYAIRPSALSIKDSINILGDLVFEQLKSSENVGADFMSHYAQVVESIGNYGKKLATQLNGNTTYSMKRDFRNKHRDDDNVDYGVRNKLEGDDNITTLSSSFGTMAWLLGSGYINESTSGLNLFRVPTMLRVITLLHESGSTEDAEVLARTMIDNLASAVFGRDGDSTHSFTPSLKDSTTGRNMLQIFTSPFRGDDFDEIYDPVEDKDEITFDSDMNFFDAIADCFSTRNLTENTDDLYAMFNDNFSAGRLIVLGTKQLFNTKLTAEIIFTWICQFLTKISDYETGNSKLLKTIFTELQTGDDKLGTLFKVFNTCYTELTNSEPLNKIDFMTIIMGDESTFGQYVQSALSDLINNLVYTNVDGVDNNDNNYTAASSASVLNQLKEFNNEMLQHCVDKISEHVVTLSGDFDYEQAQKDVRHLRRYIMEANEVVANFGANNWIFTDINDAKHQEEYLTLNHYDLTPMYKRLLDIVNMLRMATSNDELDKRLLDIVGLELSNGNK